MQLAEEACHVEIEILKSPIGKQDQYAAAFGGLNLFEFVENGSVRIEPIFTPNVDSGRLLEHSLLVWTGQTRSANSVLSDQALRSEINVSSLINMKELAFKFKDQLLMPSLDWDHLGELIKSGWNLKKELSKKISNQEIQAILTELENENCSGYKLLGAGGGGFVFALVNNVNALTSIELKNWSTIRPKLDQSGARIVSVS